MAMTAEMGRSDKGLKQGVTGPRSAWWRQAVIWMFRLFYLAVFVATAMALSIIALINMHATGESLLQVATMVQYAAYAMFVLGGAGIVCVMQHANAYAADYREQAPNATDNEINAALKAESARDMRAVLKWGR